MKSIGEELVEVTDLFVHRMVEIFSRIVVSALAEATASSAVELVSDRGTRASGGASLKSAERSPNSISVRNRVLDPSSANAIEGDQGKRAKRSESSIAEISSKLLSYVKENPGLRIEQINKGMGTTTRDLALPIRKLIASGDLRSDGQKRSTTYFAGKVERKSKTKRQKSKRKASRRRRA